MELFFNNVIVRNINSSKLTKQTILDKISQISIFSTYLNLSNNIIQHCIDTGELICSPIREDIHPTCGFKYDNKGKLKFRDFSGFFWGDAFDVVAYIMSNIYNREYNIRNKEDFIKVLRHITFTFKDIFYGQEKDINLVNEINTAIINIKHKKPNIELVVREWNNNDKEYWDKFGVPLQFLNINFIYPVEQYYINRNVNPEPKYYYNTNDPCYGYLLGKDRNGINNIKLYFPKRDRSYTRFITNCNHLEGIYNLNYSDYDIIVITKSTKDRVSIGATLMRLSLLYGGMNIDKIGVINIPHETYKLRQNEYDWLKSKLKDNKGKLCSLMDNDVTGINESNWLYENFNIIPVIIPKRYKSKDFAELVSNNSLKQLKSIIKKGIKYIYNYDKRQRNKDSENLQYDETMPY